MNIKKSQSEADALLGEVMALTLLPDLAGQQLREQTVKSIEGLQNQKIVLSNFSKLNLSADSKVKLSKTLDKLTELGGRFRLSAKFAVPPSVSSVENAFSGIISSLTKMADNYTDVGVNWQLGSEVVSSKPKSSIDVEKQFAEAMPELLSSIQTARESIVAVKDDLSKIKKSHNLLSSGYDKLEGEIKQVANASDFDYPFDSVMVQSTKKVNDAINSASKSIANIKAVVDKIDKKAYSWKLQMNKERSMGARM